MFNNFDYENEWDKLLISIFILLLSSIVILVFSVNYFYGDNECLDFSTVSSIQVIDNNQTRVYKRCVHSLQEKESKNRRMINSILSVKIKKYLDKKAKSNFIFSNEYLNVIHTLDNVLKYTFSGEISLSLDIRNKIKKVYYKNNQLFLSESLLKNNKLINEVINTILQSDNSYYKKHHLEFITSYITSKLQTNKLYSGKSWEENALVNYTFWDNYSMNELFFLSQLTKRNQKKIATTIDLFILDFKNRNQLAIMNESFANYKEMN